MSSDTSDDRTLDGSSQDVRLQMLLERWEASRAEGVLLTAGELCPDDPALRDLLAERIASLIDFDRVFASHVPRKRPGWIGTYEVLEEIGRGSSSVVYLCQQHQPRRKVALKLLQQTRIHRKQRRRFQLEIELLATLDHPGIARIFDAGSVEIGGVELPYFTMQWVDATPLTERIALLIDQDPDYSRRLSIFQQICEAVHFAHQQHVVHRDLKPANLLVDRADKAQVIDFGLAHLQVDCDASEMIWTQTLGTVGTPAYMSPEQFDRAMGPVDQRSDQYSLAVVLFEMLTGRLPYEVRGKPLIEVAMTIRDQLPPPLPNVHDRLTRPMQIVLGKALAKRPEDRYTDVQSFADDVGRVAAGIPVHARRTTALEHLASWARRYPSTAATIMVVLLLLTTLLILSAALAWQTDLQARRLRSSADRLSAERNRSIDREKILRHRTTELEASRTALQGSVERLTRSLRNAKLTRANDLAIVDGEKSRILLADTNLFSVNQRGFAWGIAASLASQQRLRFHAHEGSVHRVAISADGRRLATLGEGRIRVWNTETEERLVDLPELIHSDSEIAIDEDGSHVLVLKHNGLPVLIQPDIPSKIYLPVPDKIHGECIAISSSGDLALMGDRQGRVSFWIGRSPEFVRFIKVFEDSIASLQIVEEQGQVVRVNVASFSGRLAEIDWSTQEMNILAELALTKTQKIRWNQRAGYLTVARPFHSLEVFGKNGVSVRSWTIGLGPYPRACLIGAEQSRIVLGRRNRVELFEGTERLAYLETGPATVTSLATSTSANLVAVGYRDGTVSILSTSLSDANSFPSGDQRSVRLGLSLDEQELFVCNGNGTVGVFDTSTWQRLAMHPPSHASSVLSLIVLPRKDLFLTADSRGRILLRQQFEPQVVADVKHTDHRFARVTLLPDGETVVAGSREGGLAKFHVDALRKSSKEVFGDVVAAHQAACTAIAASDDGRWVVTGSADGEIKLWELPELRFKKRLQLENDRISGIAISPDGEQLVVAIRDGPLRSLSLPEFRIDHEVQAHGGRVTALDFHPTQPVVASGGMTGRVILWDAETWDVQADLQSNLLKVRQLLISSRGDRLFAVGESPFVYLWKAAPASSRLLPETNLPGMNLDR